MKEYYPLALEIATEAHKGQKRQCDGEDYINHPIRVADKFDLDLEKSAAVLHDTVEDSKWTPLDLLDDGISKEIVEIVEILTRKGDENYFNFIMRIIRSNNYYAIRIKIADINDNLKDIKEGSRADKYRLARYILELNNV